MLVLLDLDNTLVDRDGAFRRWASDFVHELGGDASGVEWLMHADASGYTPREALARQMIERFGLADPVDRVVDRLLYDHVEHVESYPGVTEELDLLASAGAVLAIVTNGESRQQRMKLQRTRLDQLMAGCIISGELGIKKPDPRIFTAARGLAPDEPDVWMVGDHVLADMAAARAVGASTAWVSHGRPWTMEWAPTLEAESTAVLIRRLMTSS